MKSPQNTAFRRGAHATTLAIIALLWGCSHSETTKKSAVTNPEATVPLWTVTDTRAPDTYEVTGSVRSVFNATLSSKVMGRVNGVSVKEGDVVRAGQTLLSIDARELAAAANVAGANYHASMVGVATAKTSATMESRTSAARIATAESQLQQARASLSTAEAKRDLAVAGPRTQEVTQAHIAVLQAESSMKLAKTELDRTSRLYEAGAVAKRDLDLAENRYVLAKGQFESATEGESIAREGTRAQEVRAAEEGVRQAIAALKQAESGVTLARAAALQINVRQQEIEAAQAQVKQAAASLTSANVSLSYTKVTAPFDGRIVERMVDPGSMATPGAPLLMIEGGEFRFEGKVPEKLITKVSRGQSVPIAIDALSGKVFMGKVVEIAPDGDASTHNFVVKFLLQPSPGLKSGMFGTAKIPTTYTKKLLVPSTAVWKREGLSYVYSVNREHIARLRIVTVGSVSGDSIEVFSGLNPGDVIVARDVESVSDGAKVTAKSP